MLRMRDFCLSVSLCLAAVAAILSACLLLLLIDHSSSHPFVLPPLPPVPDAHQHHFRGSEKWLIRVRWLRYGKGCDPTTSGADLPDLNIAVSPPSDHKHKQILSCAPTAQRGGNKTLISMWCFDNHLST